MWRRIAFSLFVLLGAASAQDKDAMRDVQLGMQGLAQAQQDPALLAQLMQDMQSPELMAEAKKMMEDPEWQAQMKKLTSSPDFKESIKKMTETLKDPNAQAHAEAKMEHMLKVGQDDLKKSAAAEMQNVMAKMQDPTVMAEMTKMLKDPNFTNQLKDYMQNDPSFKNYAAAMQDMMKDPATKKKFEEFSETAKKMVM